MGNPYVPPPYEANPQMATYPPHPQGPPSYAQRPTSPAPQPVATFVVPSQPMQPVIYPVGSHPSNQICRSCNARIQTRTETNANSTTHLWAFVLCILACWPCCLIPYCVDSCQTINHYCPNCNAYLGSYKD